jgi:hypothetical protein
MIKHVVQLALPYRVKFVPYRHRLPETVAVLSFGAVEIREVTPDAAPVSHRILANDGELQAEVRCFEGEYWWLLNDQDHPMSVEKFKSLAQEGDWYALNALDVSSHYAKYRSEDEFLATKPRLLDSDYTEQWTKANRGASKLLFCDSTVLVEAGPPNYYGIRETRSAMSLEVGPSSLERIRGDDPLFGPRIHTRKWAARQGLAFDALEFERERPLLQSRAETVDFLFHIEEILQMRPPQIAPWKCARALAMAIWQARTEPLEEDLPSLANADQDECPEDPMLHRALLEEFAALNPNIKLNDVTETPEDAREILRRLDLVGYPASFSDEEEAALASLVGCSETISASVRSERRSAP